MPLKIYLRPHVILSDRWMNKEDWDEVYADNLEALRELLVSEDLSAFIDDAGGPEIIQRAEWVSTLPT